MDKNDFKDLSKILKESAELLDRLPASVLTEAKIRWPIKDELAGFAIMIEDHISEEK